MVGRAKIMRYEDIVAAQSKRTAKEAAKERKRSGNASRSVEPRDQEAKRGEAEISAMGLSQCCSVLQM